MDGSAHSVVTAPAPTMHGARALIVGLILVGTLVASFTIGRLTASSGEGSTRDTGTSQVIPDASGPPVRNGDVKVG